MDNLHSRKDEEMEERDQKIFARVVIYAGIAVAIFFAVGLLVVWIGGAHLPGLSAAKHTTSCIVPGPLSI